MHTRTDPMPPCDNIELELHRLGGIDAALFLFRPRSAKESKDSYLGRIHLGAALVACKIAMTASGSAPSERGGTGITAYGVDGREFRPTRVDGSSAVLSWGPKALPLVLDALVQGWCDIFRR